VLQLQRLHLLHAAVHVAAIRNLLIGGFWVALAFAHLLLPLRSPLQTLC
jgi:hypothetical protein